MPLKEYLYKVNGYQQKTKIRRSEGRAFFYPIYATTFAALGSRRQPMSPDRYMPIGGEDDKTELVDTKGLIKKSLERWNRRSNEKQ